MSWGDRGGRPARSERAGGPPVPDGERVLGVKLAPQRVQHRGQDACLRVGPRAVDGVPVTLGVLRRLRRVLLQHAGPARTCPSSRPARGPSCSAASSPSASASDSAITVVCRSRTVPSGRAVPSCSGTPGSRVAATTGSTRRSSPGKTPCSQVSNSTALVEAERPGVVPHRARRPVGLQEEPGDHPGEARACPRAPPRADRSSAPASARTSVPSAVTTSRPVTCSQAHPRDWLSQPWPPCSRKPPSADRWRSGQRGTPGRVRPGKGASSRPPRTAGPAAAIPVAGSYAQVAHPAQVDQQHVVAQAPRCPGVAAGADADPPPAFGRQADARDHVVLVRREQHRRGEPVRPPRVEDPPDAGLLVPRLAAVQQPSGQPVAWPRGRLGHHPTTAAPPSTGMFAPLTWAPCPSRGTGSPGRRPPAAPTGPAAPARRCSRPGPRGPAATVPSAASRSSPG